jgi:hypothetical protein
MTAIITQKMKTLLMNQLKADADSSANKYYIAIGKTEDWNNTDTEPTPVITDREERDFRLSMQSAKLAANYSFVIPRVNWSSGTTYGQYDDTVVSHPTQPYYAMIDNNQVYVCLRQSRNSAGVAQVSTVAPSGTSQIPFTTSDGYAWKFLYTVGVLDNTNFTSANFLPVKKVLVLDSDGSGNITSTSTDVQQKTVQDSAVARPICGIDVTNAGAGYSSAPTVTLVGNGTGATASATVSGGAVVKVVINDSASTLKMGTGYDYAHVAFSGGGSPTTTAAARVILGPKAGFGADARDDLRAKAMMFNIQPAGTEGATPPSNVGEFHVGTSFRQIGLLKNPLDSTGAAFTGTSGNALTRLKLDNLVTAFTKGSTMTGGTSGAKGIVGATDSDEIWYHQNETTLFTAFDSGEQITDAAGGIGFVDSATGFNKTAKIDKFTGDLLYIENRAKVIRSTDQTEDIKVIIEI